MGPMKQVDTPYQHTLSTHPINTPPHPPHSYSPLSFPRQHPTSHRLQTWWLWSRRHPSRTRGLHRGIDLRQDHTVASCQRGRKSSDCFLFVWFRSRYWGVDETISINTTLPLSTYNPTYSYRTDMLYTCSLQPLIAFLPPPLTTLIYLSHRRVTVMADDQPTSQGWPIQHINHPQPITKNRTPNSIYRYYSSHILNRNPR